MPEPADKKPQWVVPGSVNTAVTLSTVSLYARLRQALLDYWSPHNERLADYLNGERIYVRAAPDLPVFPYMTLLLDRSIDVGYNGYRETAQLEVQILGRPESQLPIIESAMDIVDQCLTSYTDPGAGLIFARTRTRSTVPQFTDPAETSVVGVIGRYNLTLWPQLLTVRATGVPTTNA